MAKNKIPHKFEDCISLSPHINRSNDIVIYPIDKQSKEKIQFSEHIIPYGYLYAAELLVDGVYKKYQRPIETDDKLALPFLSLHFCSLEFSLKLLKKKLEEHQKHNTCKTINKVEERKKFHNHNLCELGEFLKASLPKKNKIHSFNDFDEILNFIKKLDEFGINLESVRYIYNKSDKTLPLHEKKHF